MTDYYAVEDQTGVRCPWNVWPNTRMDLMRNGVPLSMIYSPTKRIENLLKVQYPPVRCQKCGSILNPYNPVDYNTKQFQCCLCGTAQQFPKSYSQITEQRKPAELHPQYRALEYVIQQELEQRVVIFVVDICVEEEELQKIKESLQLAIDILPEDTKIGLITFGTTVFVHEVFFTICPRKVVFRGSLDIVPQTLEQQLNLKSTTQKFILPIAECKECLTQLIEDLHVDLWIVAEKHRPFRCTGIASSIAVSMAYCIQSPLIQAHKHPVCNLVVMTSGPCTCGPGQIVDTDIVQHVRHWPDVQQKNEAAKYVKDSVKFYTALADRAIEANTAFNVFSCSTDQVGLYEMRNICSKTGGCMLISESFAYQAFERSFRIFLESMSDVQDARIKQCGAAELQITCSQNIKISGVLGPVAPVKTQSSQISSIEIGVSGSDKFKMCALDSDSSYTVVFDLQDAPKDAGIPNRYIQLRCEYTDSTTGARSLRVVTMAFRSDYEQNIQSIVAGFDQEAAACVLARITAWRFAQAPLQDEITQQLDRIIVRTSKMFCQYVSGDHTSVRFYQNYEFFPQFLYHFRRSDMVKLFGQSPDETVMKHFQLNRQTVGSMLSMIQPVLLCYTIQDTSGQPVFLDSNECTADRILLMDSFFNLLIWYGSNIAAWRNAGYHLKPEYVNVKELLDAPIPECDEILRERFPSPRYDHADQGTSQARILLARVNPANTHKNNTTQGEVIATDDVNMQSFLDALKKAIVAVDK